MVARFTSDSQQRLFDAVLDSVRSVGFGDDLRERDYSYCDWFNPNTPSRHIDAAFFGRLPAAYDTALIGVALANGTRGVDLVNLHRALGSPLVFEIADDLVNVWAIGPTKEATKREAQLTGTEFQNWARRNAAQLRPEEFLRTKNIKKGQTTFFQGSLFAGLIPELEDRIADILEPRITSAFRAGMETYEEQVGRPPAESLLFKVAFWILTGKVFYDRRHPKFLSLGENPDPNDVLDRVANHYNEVKPQRLLNESTRLAIFSRIWNRMDFRNLSVDVLSQIWSRTLVTEETRKRLGIHRTRRSIVDFIVDRMPFRRFDPEECRVMEPCSGSATFLVAAMDRMRDTFDFQSATERHSYFKRVLRGYERDPFGYEISRLCLALSDYPNPNNWNIELESVFGSESFAASLRKTRIVLCNPPFRRFTATERAKEKAEMWDPPAELLRIVLENLHPDGVLGFVLPRTFINGKFYGTVRQQLVRRFRDLEIVRLPDKGWESAQPETALLIATKPRLDGKSASVTYGVVREREWKDFDWLHEVRTKSNGTIDAEDANKSLIVSELQDVWDYLRSCPALGEVAEAHRGLRWQKGLSDPTNEIVRDTPAQGYVRGVRPQNEHFYSFEVPQLAFLSVRPEDQKFKAFGLPWKRPKVIMNKVRKSREIWRVAAFADSTGLVCSESFIPIWPNRPELTKSLAAVLNGPVANAFLAERSGTREFSHEVIHGIPFPILSPDQIKQIDSLVDAYVSETAALSSPSDSYTKADRLLREIDATVLIGYDLPPKLERRILDHFNGSNRKETGRKVPFPFADYFPADFEPCFPLHEYLAEDFEEFSAGATRARIKRPSSEIMHAMEVSRQRTSEGP